MARGAATASLHGEGRELLTRHFPAQESLLGAVAQAEAFVLDWIAGREEQAESRRSFVEGADFVLGEGAISHDPVAPAARAGAARTPGDLGRALLGLPGASPASHGGDSAATPSSSLLRIAGHSKPQLSAFGP